MIKSETLQYTFSRRAELSNPLEPGVESISFNLRFGQVVEYEDLMWVLVHKMGRFRSIDVRG